MYRSLKYFLFDATLLCAFLAWLGPPDCWETAHARGIDFRPWGLARLALVQEYVGKPWQITWVGFALDENDPPFAIVADPKHLHIQIPSHFWKVR